MIKLYVGHRRPDIAPERLAEMTAAAVESVRAQLREELGEDVEIEAVDSHDGMVEGRDLIYLPGRLREWGELNWPRWEEIKDRVPDVPSVWEREAPAKVMPAKVQKISLPRYKLVTRGIPWQRAKI